MKQKTRSQIAFLLLGATGITACGPMVPVKKMDDLTAEQRQHLSKIGIYDQVQLVGKKYKVLNFVEGISCKNMTWDPAATKSDAINQAKYWAMQSDADGITNVQCDFPRGTTTTYNCWESITCTAEAIKFEN